MTFPFDQHPKDDVKEPQMVTLSPLRQWLQEPETRRSLIFLQREFDVSPKEAFIMLTGWSMWHDVEPLPYPDEPEENFGG